MHDVYETASLLPYLEADGTKFHVKLSVTGQDNFVHKKPSFPFLVASESGPFSRIIQGWIKTDAVSTIEPVFLLIQKDEYPLARNELWPLNNKMIDQYWQHALSFHSSEKSGSLPLRLKDQTGKNGELLPFQSLLYCQLKQTYFHPPCPDCGHPLQQCYNDEILQKYGLQPYSGSLRRYLFCPSCVVSKQNADFFVSSLTDNDPDFLKDRFDLIKSFSRLKGIENSDCQIPCIDCNRYQECYGPDGLAASRIVPLFFYPFYMLMFKSDSINAVDFLSLLSGTSFQEIENRLLAEQQRGRLNSLKVLKDKRSIETPFFFQNDNRYFLEVLYLKLSFLGDLAKAVFSSLDTFQYPELGLSIDRIWIKLSDQNSLLPFLWNFKIELLDVIGSDIQFSSISKLPPSYGFHLFGFIWFYTLLVNEKQDVAHVYPALGEAMEKIGLQEDAKFENYLGEGFLSVFSPENIFSNPDIIPVKPDWHKFWKTSLCLGFHFFKVSMLGLRDWSIEAFLYELEQLRQHIKDNMFSPQLSVPEDKSEADDNTIYNILKEIMSTWQDGFKTPPDESKTSLVSPAPDIDNTVDDKRPPDFQEDTDIFQTVILSPDDELPEKITGIEHNEEPDETVPVPESDLDETIIISLERPETPDTSNNLDHTDEDMEETVILSPEDFGQKLPPSFQPEEDDFPETVIISPELGSSGYHEAPLGPSLQDFRSEDTEKGGIMPDEMITDENEKTKKSEQDQVLEETIIIHPDKIKDKH